MRKKIGGASSAMNISAGTDYAEPARVAKCATPRISRTKMMDHKDAIQAIFEEMCYDRYDRRYWELPDETQYELYLEAQRTYVDQVADRADYLRKAERER
jgi:hypothetical protein